MIPSTVTTWLGLIAAALGAAIAAMLSYPAEAIPQQVIIVVAILDSVFTAMYVFAKNAPKQ